jgi:hypothetical protein
MSASYPFAEGAGGGVTSPLEVALAIARSGLPVFPCTTTKRPAIAKRDGGHGFLSATTDPKRIHDLFRRPGVALVGVPTGPASGFDVLDIDFRNGAAEWETANRQRLPRTRAHKSLSGGRHLLFSHVPGVRNLASKFAPGIDVRGEGGYVIFPPSTGYSIIDDAPIAGCPDWLLSLIRRTPSEPRPVPSSAPLPHDSPRIGAYVDAVLTSVRSAPDGTKHYRLRNAALSFGGLQHQLGYDDAQITDMLIAALPRSVRGWSVARETIAWGIEHGRKRPFTLEERRHFPNYGPRPIDGPPKWFAEVRPPTSEEDYGVGTRDDQHEGRAVRFVMPDERRGDFNDALVSVGNRSSAAHRGHR